MKNRYKSNFLYVVVTLVVLIAAGLATFFVFPKLSLLSKTYKNNQTDYARLTPGQSVSCDFKAPCSAFNGINIDMEVASEYEPVGMIEARIELVDQDGEILFSQKISSLLEDSFSSDDVNLVPGDTYTLSFSLDSSSEGVESVGIGVTGSGELAFEMRAVNTGAPDKSSFLIFYVLVSGLILMFVFYMDSNDPKGTRIVDVILFSAAVMMTLLVVNQYFDLFIIAKSGLRMLDAIKSGEFFHYYDHAYYSELANDSAAQFFGYNYNVFTILPVAIVMIPFSFFVDGDIGFGFWGDIVVGYLDAVVALLTVVSIKLTDKVCDVCSMPDAYRRNVRYLYAFSPLLLYTSIGFGQIDIIYVILMLWAFPFYYKSRYRMFSLVMAFAVVMKLIPLLVFIPLILLVNKRIIDIITNTLICLSVKIGTMLVFERGAGYAAIMDYTDERYGFIDMLFFTNLGSSISLFVMAYIVICVVCYLKDVDTSDKTGMLYNSMMVIFAVYAVLTAFAYVHQQWLIPLVFSFAFLVPFIGNDRRIIIIFGVVEMLLIIFCTQFNDSILMVGEGMLSIEGYSYRGMRVYDILNNFTPFAIPFIKTAVATLLLSLTGVFFAKRRDSKTDNIRPFAVGRILLLYLYMIACYWSYCFIG